jgi:type II secretory pathway component PulF
MAAFTYSAINAQGLEFSGELHAPDLAAATEQLRSRGLLADWIQEVSAAAGGEEGPLVDLRARTISGDLRIVRA